MVDEKAQLEEGLQNQEKSQKELDDEIQASKKRQAFQDDIGVLISMVSITVLAIIVVIIKVMIFSPDLDTTMTTFRPMQQSHQSNIKYTGNGYIPCNGVVPCDPKVCPETCPEANE